MNPDYTLERQREAQGMHRKAASRLVVRQRMEIA